MAEQKYRFGEGEEIILGNVRLGIPYIPVEKININCGDVETKYLRNYKAVGGHVMHEFLLMVQGADDSVGTLSIADRDIERLNERKVVPRNDARYSNRKYFHCEHIGEETRKMMEKARELLN